VLSFLSEMCLLFVRYRLFHMRFNGCKFIYLWLLFDLFSLLVDRFVELLLTFTIVLECAIET